MSFLCSSYVCRLSILPSVSKQIFMRAHWLSGRVLDSRPRGHGLELHRRHCVVSFSKNIDPSLVLVQPRKTCPFITEILLMGCKESNQTNKQTFPRNHFQFYLRSIRAAGIVHGHI